MKKVIIFTAEPDNFVPVELKKAAEENGLTAEIVDTTKCVLVEEPAGSKIYVVKEEGLVNVEVDEDTVIIPRLNEHHLEIKLGMLKRFEKLGASLLNTPESMSLCNDKLMTQIILNSAGISTPYSVMIQGIDDIETVVAALEAEQKIKYPFVIKTLRGTHGIGVMKVDSRSSLVSVAQLLAKEGLDFMLQEFCKHDRSARIIMIGSQMLAANLRGQPKEKDEFRTNSHLGSETEKYEPSEEELEIARKIVDLFGSSFCAIDYLVTDDKQIIVLEVNGSPGLENIQKNWPDKNLAAEVIRVACNCGDTSDAEPLAPETAPETAPVDNSLEASVVIGDVEKCTIHRVLNDVEARIDTGAKYSSLHVDKIELDGEWVKFTRGDTTFRILKSRDVKIRQANSIESISRPLIKLDITVRDKRVNQVEFTLNNRQNMKYEVLLGRTALSMLGIPVEIPATMTVDGEESEVYIDGEEE